MRILKHKTERYKVMIKEKESQAKHFGETNEIKINGPGCEKKEKRGKRE